MTFKGLCKQYEINYPNALYYRRKHPDLTDEQIIQYHLTPKQQSFREKCEQNNINYGNALYYKRRNPDLTDEQIIQHFIPNSYISSQGKLILI